MKDDLQTPWQRQESNAVSDESYVMLSYCADKDALGVQGLLEAWAWWKWYSQDKCTQPEDAIQIWLPQRGAQLGDVWCCSAWSTQTCKKQRVVCSVTAVAIVSVKVNNIIYYTDKPFQLWLFLLAYVSAAVYFCSGCSYLAVQHTECMHAYAVFLADICFSSDSASSNTSSSKYLNPVLVPAYICLWQRLYVKVWEGTEPWQAKRRPCSKRKNDHTH